MRTRRPRIPVLLVLSLLGAGMLAAPVFAAAAVPAPQPAAAAVATPVSAGTALVRTLDGGNWAFAVRADGRMFQTIRGSGDWIAPRVLGGGFRAGPAAVYRPQGNRIELFAVGRDGSLQTSVFSGGRWGAWKHLSRGYAGGLSAIRVGTTEIRVFGIGTDGRMYTTVRRDGVWKARQSLGGSFHTSSSAVWDSRRAQVDLFGVGTDGRIRHRQWNGAWSATWSSATVSTAYRGVAATRVGSTLKVYAVHENRQLYEFARGSGRWGTPRSLGGAVFGAPAVVSSASSIRVVATRTDGRLTQKLWVGSWRPWTLLPGTGFPSVPKPVVDRVSLAKTLIARWGGRLTGLSPVLADLRATAAGRGIRNACGGTVFLDARMLRSVVAATDRYRVAVNNMVSGRGCDSGYHPRGMAVDFNTVVDPRTGRSTNWHTGSGSDNRSLDREFLTFTARTITSGGGAGQRNCAGSAGAALPAGMARFDDSCNHQHLDNRR